MEKTFLEFQRQPKRVSFSAQLPFRTQFRQLYECNIANLVRNLRQENYFLRDLQVSFDKKHEKNLNKILLFRKMVSMFYLPAILFFRMRSTFETS